MTAGRAHFPPTAPSELAIAREDQTPTVNRFAGSNGAGKTTFARGLSPLNLQRLAVKAGKLLIHEIQGCLEFRKSFGLESTVSGTTYSKLLHQAKSIGYQIVLHCLWIPSPALSIRRIQ